MYSLLNTNCGSKGTPFPSLKERKKSRNTYPTLAESYDVY